MGGTLEAEAVICSLGDPTPSLLEPCLLVKSAPDAQQGRWMADGPTWARVESIPSERRGSCSELDHNKRNAGGCPIAAQNVLHTRKKTSGSPGDLRWPGTLSAHHASDAARRRSRRAG